MKTRIIVDSSTELMPELKEKVIVVPLMVRIGNEEYLDGVNLDHETFYKLLTEKKQVATTSQPSPAVYEQIFKQVQEEGDQAIVITLASKLSGTYQSACIAAQDYECIHVVDGTSATIGTSVLVEYAVSLVEKGMSIEEILRELEEKKKRILIVALVDTLEYLMRGGRLSKTAALAGTLLNIKPVISLVDGEIKVLGKARGSKRGNNLLIEQIAKCGGIDFDLPLLLGYSGTSTELLTRYIEDSRFLWEKDTDYPRYTSIGTAIGTHVGPGAIALAFFRKD